MHSYYYLEISEGSNRMSAGRTSGYVRLEDAIAAARSFLDDALPRNSVRVLQEVGHAFLAGDGREDYTGLDLICRCPHEDCGALFEHHGSATETTCCPDCGRQQMPHVVR